VHASHVGVDDSGSIRAAQWRHNAPRARMAFVARALARGASRRLASSSTSTTAPTPSSSRRASSVTEAATYATRGPAHEVLEVTTVPLPPMGPGDVRVRMLAAPVNPSDVNIIEGKYPLPRAVPGVGGNEGVGEVVAAGAACVGARVGDRVVPNRSYVDGTWRRDIVSACENFDVIDRDVPVHAAATLTVNPCTALRLLEDYDAREGETVVINAATSGVGRALLQIARTRGIRTIAMCRPREDARETEEVFESLRADGADVVLPDVEGKMLRLDARTRELASRARVAYNAVGGYSAQTMLRLLQPNAGSRMVTYGGMSKQPLLVPTGAFIFKDITLSGFWLTRWLEHDATHNSSRGRRAMLDEICALIRSGALVVDAARFRDVPLARLQSTLALDAADPDRPGLHKILLRL